MKPKVVKHLSNIEIDEISLVDRGANQHATVAIAKRAPEEDNMPELFNEDGELLDENQLEDGQVVYDQTGAAYQFSLDDDDDEDEDEYEDEDGLVGVGKASVWRFAPGVANNGRFGSSAKEAAGAFESGKTLGSKARMASSNAGSKVFGQGKTARKRKIGAAVGGGVAAGGGGAALYGNRKNRGGVVKSYSEQVMEALSKAYSDEERDEVLSKAFAEVDSYKSQAEQAVSIAKAERDLRLTNEYIAKAAEYNLPVDPAELGPVLYRMAEQMSYEDCVVVAKCLESAGSMIFDEIGNIGGGDNVDVLDQVNAQAMEYVTKSADGVDPFEAVNAVFDQNPEAYDAYLAQSRRGF